MRTVQDSLITWNMFSESIDISMPNILNIHCNCGRPISIPEASVTHSVEKEMRKRIEQLYEKYCEVDKLIVKLYGIDVRYYELQKMLHKVQREVKPQLEIVKNDKPEWEG